MKSEQIARATAKTEAGFSLIEMSVSLIVMMIIAAIAIPSVLQGWNSYRLTSAAGSVAGLLERTRFEAIHKNGQLSCLGAALGAGWQLGIDQNSNLGIDRGEPQVILPGPVTLIAAAIAPAPASMGAGFAGALPPGGNPVYGRVTFDARGTVIVTAGAPPPYVVYIGIPNQPKYGYRAVTVSAMGQVKTWAASKNGSWIGQ